MKRILSHKHVTRILRQNYSTEKVLNNQVFSAIQPTGEAHLGNYLGALKKWVHLQNSEENKTVFAIADLHAITIPRDPRELQRNIFVMAATVLACGIDKSIFFKQSDVKQHAELCWTLGTFATMAKLAQLPQFKEKSKLVKDTPVGIFLYPILQTADIMLYRFNFLKSYFHEVKSATHVPVGEDQIQQIQYAQHLIRIFNNRFGSTFPIPTPIIDASSGRVKSLQDPTKKMSKSDLKEIASISLMDEPDAIFKKIKKAVTDFKSEVTFDPTQRPGVSNLILIHSDLTGKTPEEIVKENKDLDTGKYKLVLAEVVIEHLNPIRKKINEYLNAEEYLISELGKGAEKAEEIAEATMKEVRESIGVNLLKVKTNSKMSGLSAN